MNKNNTWKKFFIELCVITAVLFLAVIIFVVTFDPWFHYHAPIKGLSYTLDNERYQNDGIARNFEYDGIITGTSMTENFKTSIAEECWGMDFVKISYAGSYFKEISESTERALSYNPDTKVVICSLEMAFIMFDKDLDSPEVPHPDYLYDNNPFNDVEYIFNKKILTYYIPETIGRTIKGVPADSFDEYSRFADVRPTGKDIVLAHFPKPYVADLTVHLNDEEKEIIRGNIEQNIIANAKAHPDVQFYYFIPPYSGVNWYGSQIATGTFDRYMEIFRFVSGELLQYDNIHLFCFYDDTDMVMNLDNYSDDCHFSGEISDMILVEMSKEDSPHELTADNYMEYFDHIDEFYRNYDYESLYE